MSTTMIDQIECDRCGSTGLDDTYRTEDGNDVCGNCADEFYDQCERCGDYAETTYTTSDDDTICAHCANRYYLQCDRCSAYTNTLTDTACGSEVCDSCADNAYWGCERCGELIDSGDYCDSCDDYEDDPESCHLVNSYCYKPLPSFHGDGPLFLGAELEVSVPYGYLPDCASVATSHLRDLGYLKEDGSIDHGFEIVTHPMSYAWAMEHFPWQMLAELRDNGCEATDETGLHVHVSRAAFASAGHVYRWMKFLYRNAERVTTLARRVSSWARFDSNDRQHIKDYAKGAKGCQRYRAINTQNDDTFELRVFASSLDPQEIKAALGLAAASIEYTRELTTTDIVRRDGWHWASFVSWLSDRPAYAPLRREMEALSCAC